MIDWNTCPSVEHDPDKVSGVWLFRGTRIPVSALFENIEDGVKISEFIELFPGVKNEQIHDVLEHTVKSLNAA